MDNQDAKKELLKQLDKIQAKKQQLCERAKDLKSMKEIVKAHTHAGTQALADTVLVNILVKTKDNAESLKRLQETEDWLTHKLTEMEEKESVHNGTLCFKPFAKLNK